jgi:threonine/homoserine/homoserine lactone efflux protein
MSAGLSIIQAKDHRGFMATSGPIDTAIGVAVLRRVVGPLVSWTRRTPQQLARVAGVITAICWMASATGVGVFAKVTTHDSFTFALGVICGLILAYLVLRRSRDIERAIGQGPGENGSIPAGLLVLLMGAARTRSFYLYLVCFMLVVMALQPPPVGVFVVEAASYVFMMAAWYFASTVMNPPPKRERVRMGVRGLIPLGVPSS